MLNKDSLINETRRLLKGNKHLTFDKIEVWDGRFSEGRVISNPRFDVILQSVDYDESNEDLRMWWITVRDGLAKKFPEYFDGGRYQEKGEWSIFMLQEKRG